MMESTIARVCDALRGKGWTVLKREGHPHKLPESISGRYKNLPSGWISFLNSIRTCVRPDETAWFLCMEDYERQDDGAFRWNEFELMSLQAAASDHDTGWRKSIRAFWDNHLPICLCVNGEYKYYAIRVSDGAVVYGMEPEFEETQDVAPCFEKFMEMVETGQWNL